MKIETVTVRYGELRSTGYPAFSNKRVEVELTARLSTGDTARSAKDELLAIARREVGIAFGDFSADAPALMDLPF